MNAALAILLDMNRRIGEAAAPADSDPALCLRCQKNPRRQEPVVNGHQKTIAWLQCDECLKAADL